MLRDLRRLAGETVIYGLTTVLGRLLSFLLTPLFTHLLTRDESGVVQTLYSYIGFLTVVYGLGLDVAYLRLGRQDGKRDPAAFTGALACVSVFAAVVSAVVCLVAAPLADAMGMPAEMAGVVRLAAVILTVDAAALIPYTELRGSHRAGTYASVKMVGIVLNLALAWVLVRGMGLGVRGVFLANVAASAVSLACLLPFLWDCLGAPDAARLPEMLSFGVPLIFAGLGSMVVQVADRPMMTKMRGLATAGLYGNCYKLGIFMMLLVSMFDQAWKPFVLERADDKGVDLLIARVLTYFATLGCWAFLGIAFFVADLVKVPLLAGHPLFHPAYWEGLPIVPVVTLGYLFNGLYFVMLAPLLIDKRIQSVGVATWIGALLNIGANLVLIPASGMMGAAWATCVAYIGMAAAVWLLGRRTRKVAYEWRRLFMLTVWTAVLFGLGARFGIPVRIVLAAAYPLGLWLAGFLHAEELDELKAMFRRKPAPASA